MNRAPEDAGVEVLGAALDLDEEVADAPEDVNVVVVNDRQHKSHILAKFANGNINITQQHQRETHR